MFNVLVSRKFLRIILWHFHFTYWCHRTPFVLFFDTSTLRVTVKEVFQLISRSFQDILAHPPSQGALSTKTRMQGSRESLLEWEHISNGGNDGTGDSLEPGHFNKEISSQLDIETKAKRKRKSDIKGRGWYQSYTAYKSDVILSPSQKTTKPNPQ